jgi:pimeloyl-ACP methyl ester carboxylesterase
MTTETRYLDRPSGRVAYSLHEPTTAHGSAGDDAPLVVLSPGMGDLRGVFRDVVGPLTGEGFRVAVADLRGHGESETTFDAYDLPSIAGDLEALLEHLGTPAALVGHSVSAGAAAVVAARRPDLVRSLVLLSPHLHPAAGALQTLLARLMTQAIRRPVGAALWLGYYRSLSKGSHPGWFPEHLTAVRAALRDGAHLVAFGRLARSLVASHTPVPLDRVAAPTLVVHGALDPEFTDPAAELAAALAGLAGSAASVDGLLVPEAGHYPHAQRADVVVPALLTHLARARA